MRLTIHDWKQPSHRSSNDGTHCAELKLYSNGVVAMRSSLDPDSRIELNQGEFHALIHAIKAGEYDHYYQA